MKQSIADRNDIDFVLYEQLDLQALLSNSKFKNLNRKTIDLIINEARNLAIKEILPTLADGDRTGVKFDNGHVQLPVCYHRPYRLMQEGEWIAMTADIALGVFAMNRQRVAFFIVLALPVTRWGDSACTGISTSRGRSGIYSREVRCVSIWANRGFVSHDISRLP